MNCKTRAISLLTGSALALSLATSAMAVDSTVKLDDGSCAISASISSPADFGVWRYSSGAPGWIPNSTGTTGTESISFGIYESSLSRQESCNVTVTASPLAQDDDTIPVTLTVVSTSMSTTDTSDGDTPAEVVFDMLPKSGVSVTFNIPNPLNYELPKGTYSGTIVVTDNSSATG